MEKNNDTSKKIIEDALSNQWVDANFTKPELSKPEDLDDVLTSKQVFFKVRYHGGIYHGWYIARPVEDHWLDDDTELDDVEYEYFFNANVGDELFSEDSVELWMYCPVSSDPNIQSKLYQDDEDD